jgi:hypothetical protein
MLFFLTLLISRNNETMANHIKPFSTLNHGYATKEGCRTERKSRNLKYAMGVRLTRFTT